MRGRDYCRNCGQNLPQLCLSLGNQPPPNIVAKTLPESLSVTKNPLELRICDICSLGQVGDYFSREEVFPSTYTYQSGISKAWREYSFYRAHQLQKELPLSAKARVLEIASNDGSALVPFVEMGWETYGVEPVTNLAQLSKTLGVTKVFNFFFCANAAERIKKDLGKIDLIFANNVAAHVPDIHDFFNGASTLMSNNSILSIENPGLESLIENLYLDTIYHEHYSYLSATSMLKILERHHLKLLDVQLIPLHGGSIRYLIGKEGCDRIPNLANINAQLIREENVGIRNNFSVETFYNRASQALSAAKDFFDYYTSEGIVGFGAAAKATVILNVLSVNSQLSAIYDSNPLKQGNYIPGTPIRIFPLLDMKHSKFHHVIIFPWNITQEFLIWKKEHLPDSVKMWRLLPEPMEVRI